MFIPFYSLRVGEAGRNRNISCFYWFKTEQPQTHQYEHADDHGERIVIDVAGLEAAYQPANPATTRAVPLTMKPSITATSPKLHKPRAERARAAGEEPGIELVDSNTSFEQHGIERPQPRLSSAGRSGCTRYRYQAVTMPATASQNGRVETACSHHAQHAVEFSPTSLPLPRAAA